jgi:hypothetical protein
MLVTVQTSPAPAEQERQATPTSTELQALRAAVVQAIRRDSLQEPARYLDEVRVPGGGE